MTFSIVNTTTRRKVMPSRKTRKTEFKSRPAALAALNKYCRTLELDTATSDRSHLVIMTEEEYRAQVRMKRVQNLMSKEWIEIPEDTPNYCDPSCEAYWSM